MSQIDEAAQRRAAAAASRREEHIAALELERQGYVARGNDDRVKQVDEQIALAKKAKPAEEPTPAPAPEPAPAEATTAPAAPPVLKKATPKRGTAKPATK